MIVKHKYLCYYNVTNTPAKGGGSIQLQMNNSPNLWEISNMQIKGLTN